MREVSVENDKFPAVVLRCDLYDTNNLTGKPLTLNDFSDVKELYKFNYQYNKFKKDIDNNHNNKINIK